ncbi:type I secretion C-terminal target domain-containing protein [Roseomonas sp. SSH11]|uniref:Type I secretion C-terminal target domain-containing protein n=1 Tax=Pararoseomonas baculiformis TaxID=2820812 RepID=A0ABS4AJW2_9PROT|nr:calcium-binding protein [Pararoseomonas baculiformis]MBP0447176.1 type I secretion C-terminal target domain-containing protein [Pararoseomonas baculiformis]
MALRNGTAGNDTVAGTQDADTISGLAGNDTLTGLGGADLLDGGQGHDSLDGGEGNDTLRGGEGNDTITDVSGANRIEGGGGDDIIVTSRGGFADQIMGGTGRDLFKVQANPRQAVTADTITDFQTGAGGDQLDLSYALSYATGWTYSSNPFAGGFLRLVQSGANTLLQMDHDGTAGAAGWQTLLVLSNTTATAFTADNIADGWNPQGTQGRSVTGGDGADTLTGSHDNDTISGGGGEDYIQAGYGQDTVRGGDGDDDIYGGLAADTLYGDDGDDYFDGGADADLIEGGAGSDTLYGGDGNDTLLGGDGNDRISDSSGTNVIDGGAGNDFIAVSHGEYAETVLGGSGRDTFSVQASLSGTVRADTIGDFRTGARGDLLDISPLYGALAQWSYTENPFANGYMRLFQSGADTWLQVDKDGSGTGSGWVTVLILKNVTATGITAVNIADGWNPHATRGTGLTGGDFGDSLNGGVNADTLLGGGGDDYLSGGHGMDLLRGGEGEDSVYGGHGDDRVQGEGGDDYLDGGDGADRLEGGTGADTLNGGAGNDVLLGGDGGDNIADYYGANRIDAGGGDDVITVSAGDGVDTITGGAGRDTYVIRPDLDGRVRAGVVTDFQLGRGGDVLDLTNILYDLENWAAGTNPFARHLRLVQSGADTLLQVDRDGSGAADGWMTVLVLQNVTASALGAFNFSAPYHNTAGGAAAIALGVTWNGGTGADTRNGGTGDDTLYGRDGNDTLNGGEGDDYLDGGHGSNQLTGGLGNDSLYGGTGASLLNGDEGNDYLYSSSYAGSNATLRGGIGDDTLTGGGGAELLDGGDGNDVFSDYEGNNTLIGGHGADIFRDLSYGNGMDTVTGGEGRDTFEVDWWNATTFKADLVTDFQAGAGGDILNLSYSYSHLGLPIGTNPFTSGYFRLLQNGADTLVQVDSDGAAGSRGWVTVLQLQGVTAADIVADNIWDGWNPTAVTGITLTGLEWNSETLRGTVNNDLLKGMGGADTLEGGIGLDSLLGGEGNDYLAGGYNNDTLIGDQGHDTLYGGQEGDVLDGGAGDDLLHGDAGNDRLLGGTGNDTLSDYQGTNRLEGGDGQDLFLNVSYGAGADRLIGGAGADTYKLALNWSEAVAVDTITDFETGTTDDQLDLSGVLARLTGYVSGSNPFATGHLRLRASGSDSFLQVDADGSGGEAGYVSVLRLVGVTPALLTSENFTQGFHPNGTSLATGSGFAGQADEIWGFSG